MEELSPMQKDQIVSWSVQRDTLLKEIAVLKDEKGKYLKTYEDRGISADDFLNVNLERKDELSNQIEALENDIKKLRGTKVSLDEEVGERNKLLSDIKDLRAISNDLQERNVRASTMLIDKEKENKKNSLQEEITSLEITRDDLKKKNIELAESYTEISNKIVASKARMEELDKQEKDYMDIADVNIITLEVEKSRLETRIPSLQKEVTTLSVLKDELMRDVEFLTNTQKEIFSRTGVLEKIVEHVTKVSSANIKELDNSVVQLTTKVEGILALSDEKLKAHTDILNEIPKLFVELSKKVLIKQKI